MTSLIKVLPSYIHAGMSAKRAFFQMSANIANIMNEGLTIALLFMETSLVKLETSILKILVRKVSVPHLG
jgi:hypothetical protein